MAETPPSAPTRTADLIAEYAAAFAAMGLAGWVLWVVGQAIAARLYYPGDIEWMEGATLVSAMRARDGLPLYGAPAGDYIPFIYPPLYAWIVGALSHVFPLGYTLGRSVSAACTVVAGGALVFGARKEGASWPLALSTLGLFAACWDDSGTFYDLCRTDALSLALMGWAVVLTPLPSPRATVAGGLLLAVAFTAKQHVALLGIPMLVWVWRTHGRDRAKLFALASVVPAVLFLIGMSVATGGDFLRWLILVPAAHGQTLARLIPGAQIEVWRAMPLVMTAVLLAASWVWKRSYWAMIAGMTLVIVSIMRGHTGGYVNVLIPMFWVECLLPVVAASAWGGARARAVAGVVVALQLAIWRLDTGRFWDKVSAGLPISTAWAGAQLDPQRYVPTAGDAANVRKLIDEIAKLPDPILIPHAPWYAVMAKKRTSFALITLWDIDHVHGAFHDDVARIDDAIAHDFQSAVLPDDKLGHDFADNWVKKGPIGARDPSTRTGWPVRLKYVYLPHPE